MAGIFGLLSPPHCIISGMTEDLDRRPHAGKVEVAGKEIELEYYIDDFDKIWSSVLSGLPVEERLLLEMDDGRILEFHVHEGAMIAHGPPLGPNESRYIY